MDFEPLGRMNPPRTNMTRRERTPPVLDTIIVLQNPAVALKSAAAICWIKKMRRSCLKNLHYEKNLT